MVFYEHANKSLLLQAPSQFLIPVPVSPNWGSSLGQHRTLFVLLTSVCIVLLHNMSLKARPQTAADTLVNYKFENRTKWLKGPQIGHWDADEVGAALGEEIASQRSPGQALKKKYLKITEMKRLINLFAIDYSMEILLKLTIRLLLLIFSTRGTMEFTLFTQ